MNKKIQEIRSLHVYRTYFPDPPGGLQEAIRQICYAVQDFGVKNDIFTLSPNPNPALINRPEASVIRARSWMAPASCDLGGLEAFRLYYQLSRKADVVHFQFPWPFMDLLDLTSSDRPSVLTYHSDIVRQKLLGSAYAPLMKRTLRKVDAIVATSPAYAATSPILSDPEIREKVRVIPLGIVESSYPAHGDDSVFNRLGLGVGEPYFFFIGVLRYYKGLHTLIQAAQQIGARIVVAGSGPEGASLQKMALELAAGNVFFAGRVTDEEKVSLIKGCRALVLPSHLRSEAFGMVLIEAAMLGKPMVSCEIGTGTSYVNHHAESGLVVPPEDPDALAAALKLLLTDESLATRLGQGARARYERMFSGPALGRAYADLYREVIGR